MLKGGYIWLLSEVYTVAAIPYVSAYNVTETVCVYSDEPRAWNHLCQLLENSNNPIKVNRFR
jgi:hypothetical protein